MTDISKCSGVKCPKKRSCYRFLAPASKYWQSYGSFQYDKNTKSCDHYWDVEKSPLKPAIAHKHPNPLLNE